MSELPSLSPPPPPHSPLARAWDTGQRLLGAGHYLAARHELEAAETFAWRQRAADTLARLYLPLLETRRQIRQLACDGLLWLPPAAPWDHQQRAAREFLRQPAGTLLLSGPQAPALARQVQTTARARGRCLECLLLLTHHGEERLASLGDPHWAAGLRITRTNSPTTLINPELSPHMLVPLPPPGRYAPGERWHSVARESVLIAWETLALQWQSRHPVQPRIGTNAAWEEMAWLRRALAIDPACEPILMRLIAVAEALARHP